MYRHILSKDDSKRQGRDGVHAFTSRKLNLINQSPLLNSLVMNSYNYLISIQVDINQQTRRMQTPLGKKDTANPIFLALSFRLKQERSNTYHVSETGFYGF